MKNKTYCASLILLTSTSLQAAYENVYSVKEGDNLNLILNNFINYGVGPAKSALYEDILKYNQFIKNPNLIYPGQTLVLPDLQDVVYEVKRGETFNEIVKNHKHLAPHITLRKQIAKTILANPHIKDPNLLDVGDKLVLGKVLNSAPTKEFASYKVKKGDSVSKIINTRYTGIDTQQALTYIKALNPQITNFDVIEPNETIKLPSPAHVKYSLDKYIARAVASVKRIKPHYFYPDELGFEIKKMDSDEAGEYISHFQKLTKTDSPKEWKNIFDEVLEISKSEDHDNIKRAFYLYSIDIEQDSSVARTREEVKEFLKVWKEAREKRFTL